MINGKLEFFEISNNDNNNDANDYNIIFSLVY